MICETSAIKYNTLDGSQRCYTLLTVRLYLPQMTPKLFYMLLFAEPTSLVTATTRNDINDARLMISIAIAFRAAPLTEFPV